MKWYCLMEVDYFDGTKCWGDIIMCSRNKEELEELKELLEKKFLKELEIYDL